MEVVAVAGSREGQGASAAPLTPLPSRSSTGPQSVPAKRSANWGDSLVGFEPPPPPLALGQVYGKPNGISIGDSGWRGRGDSRWWGRGDSLGGLEASAIPPRSTPTAPNCACEERPAAFSS
jgi:hypothetical protein